MRLTAVDAEEAEEEAAQEAAEEAEEGAELGEKEAALWRLLQVSDVSQIPR